jgi:LysM repeat protein
MSETTNLNSELLSADARGRKHIPFAVFAVIVVHIILFLVLLVAAGCRAKARARLNAKPNSKMLAQQEVSPAQKPVSPAQQAVVPASYVPTNILAAAVPVPALIQPIVVTEPPAEKVEKPASPAPLRKAKTSPPAAQRPIARAAKKPKIYVVKAGDTVEKIAKMHGTSVQALKAENNLKNQLLHPGQQLRVSSQKQKPSNQV